ncbi:MAG: phosphate acyltransferase, partial [Proteobacteria bacterium]|nr:phosphate acyltransferase [Pseudomonadota bacterium]
MYKLAVDAMGGDYGPGITVPACVDFLVSTPNASILLVGDRTAIQKELDSYKQRRKIGNSLVDEVCNPRGGRLTIRHTELEIKMDQAPANALKHGKDSSLWICLDEVKNGDSDGAVSAGNTGALMALSRYIVKTISGISRPAIASSLPNVSGSGTTVLDLGANISCDADQLLQFAIMGTAFSSAVENITSPSVGLLNVGTESSKGDGVLRQAGKLLTESPINFIGNVEGNDIFCGKVDVVVCDGLTG